MNSMYLKHFGMQTAPFSITPDTSFFLSRAGYQDALNVLLVALRSGEGFIKVTGEVGTGKTMLCRKLLRTLDSEFVTAYIHNPYLEPSALLLAVAEELTGGGCDPAMGQHSLLKLITQALTDFHAEGRHVVLCLDEVQAMPVETLETLRLLTNLETETSKLLQVVLFGQPELDVLLERPSVRQLRQRITFSYQLLPMNSICLQAYVGHRLSVSGYKGRSLFSKQAMDILAVAGRGIPRLVNILCNKALMSAYGKGSDHVNGKDMEIAVLDTLDAQGARAPRMLFWWPALTRWAFGVALFGAVIAGSVNVPLEKFLELLS